MDLSGPMPESAIQFVLLPGMDGTGELFDDFVKAIPPKYRATVVRYPDGYFLSYQELEALVHSAVPATDPFVLAAESFSTPLAIQCAAKNQLNLLGLVLCAGFATSPLRGWRRSISSLFAPILFRMPLSKFAARYFLVGSGASSALVESVQKVIATVHPQVLAERLRAALNADARLELVHVPILYLQARQDRLVGSHCVKGILRVQKDVVIKTIPGPHLILQREPLEAAKMIVEFIETINPAG